MFNLLFSKENPLPLIKVLPFPAVGAIEVWSDANGHIVASPSIGLYIPSSGPTGPLIASLALPRAFLQAKDEQGR